jgi:hypothetical protein
MKWEYCLTDHPVPDSRDEMEQVDGTLNEFGAVGWEAVSASIERDQGIFGLFERPEWPGNCLVPPVIWQDLRHLICEDVHVDRGFFCLPTLLVWTFECLRLSGKSLAEPAQQSRNFEGPGLERNESHTCSR